MLVRAIERYCGLPVVGVLPRDERLAIPDRHLGLVPRGEDETLVPAIAAAATPWRRASTWRHPGNRATAPTLEAPPEPPSASGRARGSQSACCATARSRSTTPRTWRRWSRRARSWSLSTRWATAPARRGRAVHWRRLSGDVRAELEANRPLSADLRAAVEDGLPVYAECGGLMYLAGPSPTGDCTAQMVGALPCEVHMTRRPQGHGYVAATSLAQSVLQVGWPSVAMSSTTARGGAARLASRLPRHARPWTGRPARRPDVQECAGLVCAPARFGHARMGAGNGGGSPASPWSGKNGDLDRCRPQP